MRLPRASRSFASAIATARASSTPTGRFLTIEEAIKDQGGLLWVDIQGPDEHAGSHLENWLCDHFHFHALAVEDALRQTHVPKVDDWGEYLYIVFHVARIVPETDALELQELDIFLGKNYLITYHTVPLPILDQDRQSIERDPRDRLRQGADHLLVRFLELAIDQSLKAIEDLDEQIDDIQNAVIDERDAQKLEDDLPDQALGDPAPQDPFTPARGPEPFGPRSVPTDSVQASRVFS